MGKGEVPSDSSPKGQTEKQVEGCLDSTGSVATQDLEVCGIASMVLTVEIAEAPSVCPQSSKTWRR